MRQMFMYVFALTLIFTGCSEDDTAYSSSSDITDAVFTNTSTDCTDYVGTYTSSITDVGTSTSCSGSLVIASSSSTCTFTTNSIPNHDVNDGTSSFVTRLAEFDDVLTITSSPADAGSNTDLDLGIPTIVFLNG